MLPDSRTLVSLPEQNTLPDGVLGLGCRLLQLEGLGSAHIGFCFTHATDVLYVNSRAR
jgi:hypothetical protein